LRCLIVNGKGVAVNENGFRCMSTVHFAFLLFLVTLFGASTSSAQGAEGPLKPYKDSLFSRQTVLEQADGGRYEVIDYQELRDINERDEIPERRVKRTYVTPIARKAQALETVQADGRAVEVGRTGQSTGQAFTVIFIHGRGGDRRLGMNDYSFGGNFNRLKNLAVENGGTYYAPSVKTFDAQGVADVAALISYARQQSGGRPVILACASMGSFICYGISRDPHAVANLKGMALLGGAPDPDLAASAAAKAKLPIWFTHGTNDSVYKSADQVSIYRQLLKAGQPVRFTMFQTGSHGTPVRMSDWRAILNWILVT
jgi:hypothetical protein